MRLLAFGGPLLFVSSCEKPLANVRFKGSSGRRATVRVPITFARVRPDAGGAR